MCWPWHKLCVSLSGDGIKQVPLVKTHTDIDFQQTGFYLRNVACFMTYTYLNIKNNSIDENATKIRTFGASI